MNALNPLNEMIEWSARRNTQEKKYEVFAKEETDFTEANREANRMNIQLGWTKYRIRKVTS